MEGCGCLSIDDLLIPEVSGEKEVSISVPVYFEVEKGKHLSDYDYFNQVPEYNSFDGLVHLSPSAAVGLFIIYSSLKTPGILASIYTGGGEIQKIHRDRLAKLYGKQIVKKIKEFYPEVYQEVIDMNNIALKNRNNPSQQHLARLAAYVLREALDVSYSDINNLVKSHLIRISKSNRGGKCWESTIAALKKKGFTAAPYMLESVEIFIKEFKESSERTKSLQKPEIVNSLLISQVDLNKESKSIIETIETSLEDMNNCIKSVKNNTDIDIQLRQLLVQIQMNNLDALKELVKING